MKSYSIKYNFLFSVYRRPDSNDQQSLLRYNKFLCTLFCLNKTNKIDTNRIFASRVESEVAGFFVFSE